MLTSKSCIIIFITGLFLVSCVKDNLDFPDEKPTEVSESIAIVTLLNAIATASTSSDDLCFDFVYPIDLSFSSGIVISVENQEGLLETITSQSNDFYISGISFPFSIIKNNEIYNINSENEFTELLTSCGIKFIRSALDHTNEQCFDIQYPIELIDHQGKKIKIASTDELIHFHETQGTTYQTQFVFPFDVKVFSENRVVTIDNYFELSKLISSCKGCPFVFFQYDQIETFRFKFYPQIGDRATHYSWLINDKEVRYQKAADIAKLDTLLKSGTYKVCLKAVSDDCVMGSYFCKEITLTETCPELYFEAVQDTVNLSMYTFHSTNSTIDSFNWYIDGRLLEGKNSPQIEVSETTGIHEVCIKTETPNCPSGASYCEKIAFGCLPLGNGFLAEQETWGYVFTADFIGKEYVTYIWSVYLNDDLQGYKIHEPGSSDDHSFSWQFEPGITYEICLKQDGPCVDSQVCRVFSIQ